MIYLFFMAPTGHPPFDLHAYMAFLLFIAPTGHPPFDLLYSYRTFLFFISTDWTSPSRSARLPFHFIAPTRTSPSLAFDTNPSLLSITVQHPHCVCPTLWIPTKPPRFPISPCPSQPFHTRLAAGHSPTGPGNSDFSPLGFNGR